MLRRPERNAAKAMTCRSNFCTAVHEVILQPMKYMPAVQTAVVNFFETHHITKYIAYAMSTGNWLMTPHSTHNTGNSMAAAVAVKTGVIQQLTCLNFLAVLSHVRRVCMPLDRVGRGSRPRQLHPSPARPASRSGEAATSPSTAIFAQWARVSPATQGSRSHRPVETPEGPACGLIKAFALGTRITNGHRRVQAEIRQRCLSLIPKFATEAPEGGSYVFLNGDILGEVGDVLGYVRTVREVCNDGTEVHHMVSACVSHGHVYVSSDEGRVLRPLAHPALFDEDFTETPVGELIRRDRIRYLDAAEVLTLDILSDYRDLGKRPADAVEIHPSLILGVTASFIPFIQCLGSCSHGADGSHAAQSVTPQRLPNQHGTPGRGGLSARGWRAQ